ncbi:MAG: hypothetical protein D6731_24980 [Planctomycetota bacterium]|nr:MAG: hypothetical protein D6731_24980 [Planctomycetota bacterium]
MPGFRVFSHYFLFPLPMALLFCVALADFLRSAGIGLRLQAVATASTVFATLPTHVGSLERRDVEDDVRVGAWLRQNVPPGERIYGWGSSPQLDSFSRRLPASRFTACWYVVNDLDVVGLPDSDAEAVERLLSDLTRYPPSVVVLPRASVFVWGDPQRYQLERTPPFAAWLRARYERVGTIRRHDIYVPKGVRRRSRGRGSGGGAR